ncbi:MAG: ribosomal RNA small subunit methyltransferase A [Candidatus Nealsonbacteria bacterium RBG_13_37_56]|uniref:Ribosomal RNA small subunit methyltransferase A n=1 Tax=Candidatus Nealsonbacteria bacterium RBG_13_37_56 TaxID=1801661 RepID=A0A1G2DWG9_9BACT|nr:MAG: ribosomal RNA small subunit methyltransferase A [Candidatus Nealsonbacteria bacterium RBG_13_37_56]
MKPIKHLGQNFLIDKNTVRKVIKTADLKPEDIILEIGPGLGALTQELAKKAKKIIAVEKDARMCQALKEQLKDFDNIEIINQDILKFEIIKLFKNLKFKIKNYKIVANLPFYITAPVIRKFLESENPPQEMVLIIQKEVAQRISAQPPKMSILAVSVQFYAEAKIISYISKKSFRPRPKVDAAIIKIKPENKYQTDDAKFFKIVKAGFSQPRKQLINNLSKKLKINKQKINSLLFSAGVEPTQRAETLSINDWLDLSKVL